MWCYVVLPASWGGCLVYLLLYACFPAKLFCCPTRVLLCGYVYALPASRGGPVCVLLHALLLLVLLLSYFYSQSGVAWLVWSIIVESLKFRSVCCFADMRRRHSGAVCCFVARCFTSRPVCCFVMLFYSTTTNFKVCSLINFAASLSLLWEL